MTAKTNNITREITVKSSTDNLAAIREFIQNSALESGFSQEIVSKISLAVDEACTNVIKHAYKFSPDREITVHTKLEKSKFTILITDTGDKFDPNLIPEPNLKEYHKQRKVGGLGMYLMKKLMDEVQYNTLSGNQNQVVLVKYLV
ncbi:MAG: ATP-binding protein [Melioribacteraceae bacterium]|nr:ATP-binding protein [Melioribacteraceae bacterium]RJR10088.1 MAG: ATP-binding protein [Candidatus Parcubacteria bacterium]WKZ68581.1 MAG: ATP-binding protein [Melioribacteraceae bacterium]